MQRPESNGIAGVDLRPLPWQARREHLELLAQAFENPYRLVQPVEPSPRLVEDMAAGILEGIVLKDRRSTYRDGSRAGWHKVKDRSWYERESWRFGRRWGRHGVTRRTGSASSDY
jgi:ATP-dependent DNA ligase